MASFALIISRTNPHSFFKLDIRWDLDIIRCWLGFRVSHKTGELLCCNFHEFSASYSSKTNARNLIRLHILLHFQINTIPLSSLSAYCPADIAFMLFSLGILVANILKCEVLKFNNLFERSDAHLNIQWIYIFRILMMGIDSVI